MQWSLQTCRWLCLCRPVSVSLCLCVCLFDSFALARACKLCALSPRWCVAVAVVAAFCGKSLAVVPFRLSASKLISCNCVGVRTWLTLCLLRCLPLCLCWPLVAVCCHQFMRIYYNIYACKLCDAPRINYTPGSKSTWMLPALRVQNIAQRKKISRKK